MVNDIPWYCEACDSWFVPGQPCDCQPRPDVVHEEQPMPVVNDRPSIQSMVRADLEEREKVGISRYGTPLQAHNGRDALRDAYEEVMDLACYLRQMIEERRGSKPDEDMVEALVRVVIRDRYERWDYLKTLGEDGFPKFESAVRKIGQVRADVMAILSFLIRGNGSD